jgi:tetratricopeptide (TPR) repeat protein
MILNSVGGVLQRLGKFQEAADALERSQAISEQLGDERGLAMVLNSLGGVLQRLGKFQEAADGLARSHRLLEEQGDERGQAMVLNSLGGVLQRLGKFQEAADGLARSHRLLEEQGDERGQAMVLNSLGSVLQRLGRVAEADHAFASSIEIGNRLGDKVHLAKVRTAYGKALISRGATDRGIAELREGFLLDEQTRNRRGVAIVTPLLVNALREQGRHEEAGQLLNRALAVASNENAIQRLLQTGKPSASIPTARLTARIKRLLAPMGRPRFGFLTTDSDGADVYFSERQIGSEVFSHLSEGARVQADVFITGDGRRQARAIHLM